jgi:hypothetical protein
MKVLELLREWTWNSVEKEELFARLSEFDLNLWEFDKNKWDKFFFSSGMWYGYWMAQKDVREIIEKFENFEIEEEEEI